ncbi:MAG: hypothetical protein IIV89_06525, partial [Bacteroidaceae bacterium]|nr:hypothetical protein [Bacteroidaceae bacterium]
TIEPYNESDEVHFGDAGNGRAVAWVRFGETTDSEGNRVLVIDEIQSKRHQDGREKGYKSSEAQKLQQERDALYDKMYTSGLSVEEHNRFKELGELLADVSSDGVPAAPFEKNWYELAMKRMLRLTAEEGFDKVAWTTGEQQAERYALSRSVADVVSEDNNIEVFENGVAVAKDIRITTNTGSAIDIKTEEDGTIHGGEYDGKNIGDVVGKELAAKLMNPGYVFLSGDGLRIGGEGMKGFYDRMLPSFVQKYTKKWGAKVGEVSMPELGENGMIMHSVDVTPEMQESVMEGQTMFRFIGEKGARSLDRREEENGDFNFTPRRGVSTEEREKKMNIRTEELAEALNERGFDTTISKSRTSFGMSNYIIVRSKSGEVLKKIRLSDHSVTNTRRVLNEYHTMSTDTVEGIVADLMGEKEREIGNRISNLTNAQWMESRGKDAKTIKLATGWERGADGKWRYETEDAKVNREAQLFGLNDNKRYPVAGFIEKGRVDIDGTVRLDKLIDDEALFDAYPGLREYYVTFEEMEPGTVGSHNYDDKVIRFNRRESIDKLTSTLNHEIQHAVQHIEGFALGSNVERFADVRGAVLDSLNFMTNGDLLNGSAISDVQSLRDALNKKIPYTEMSVKEGYAENLQKVARKYGYENIDALVDDFTNMPSAFEQYRRTAGEVESRNVQERMGMTPEERRNSLAEETADVAKEDQIFLFENQGTSAMMGSRVDARMAQVASELDARELSPEQRAVADVFGGKADNLTISVKTKEGKTRNVEMRQGNDLAGAKHSLYTHYGTTKGVINADDLLLIPDVIANGERTENGKKAVYKLDVNGTKYTVVTYVKQNKEEFHNFYSNKKGQPSQSVNASIGDTQSARITEELASADKGNTSSA